METTRLSSKGQIVLPKNIRDSRLWGPGTRFVVEETADGILLRPTGSFATTKLEDVAGSLKVQGPPRSLAEMSEAGTREVTRRRARGRY